MISLEVFLAGLMAVSTCTGIVTEAIKKILEACGRKFDSNILAGIVAAMLSVGVGIGYIAFMGLSFNAPSIISIIGLAVASWVSSMVGYDKVVQIITRLKTMKKG